MHFIFALLCSFLGLLPFQCFRCLKMAAVCMPLLPHNLYISIYIFSITNSTLVQFGQLNNEFSRLYHNLFELIKYYSFIFASSRLFQLVSFNEGEHNSDRIV